MTTVGLVVEGTLDYPIVAAFLEGKLPAKFPRPIKVKHLQPAPDASTGIYGGGGWGRVVGWCKANQADRIESYFNPLEEGDDACDLIIIQMDGDAMGPCAAHLKVTSPDEPCSIEIRLGALGSFMEQCLSPTAERRGQICFAFPTMHSEAWLLAALRPSERNWEEEADAKTPFRAMKTDRKMNFANFYAEKSHEAAALADSICEQSTSFARYVESLKTT